MHSTCTSSVNGIPLEGEGGWKDRWMDGWREKEMNVSCLFEAGINNTISAEGWLLASDYEYIWFGYELTDWL